MLNTHTHLKSKYAFNADLITIYMCCLEPTNLAAPKVITSLITKD